MKWNEMTTVRKIICVIGFVCGFAYLVLSFFDLYDIPVIPKVALFPLFGIFWLCMGINQKSRKLAIMNYVLAAGYFLLSLFDVFFR